MKFSLNSFLICVSLIAGVWGTDVYADAGTPASGGATTCASGYTYNATFPGCVENVCPYRKYVYAAFVNAYKCTGYNLPDCSQLGGVVPAPLKTTSDGSVIIAPENLMKIYACAKPAPVSAPTPWCPPDTALNSSLTGKNICLSTSCPKKVYQNSGGDPLVYRCGGVANQTCGAGTAGYNIPASGKQYPTGEILLDRNSTVGTDCKCPDQYFYSFDLQACVQTPCPQFVYNAKDSTTGMYSCFSGRTVPTACSNGQNLASFVTQYNSSRVINNPAGFNACIAPAPAPTPAPAPAPTPAPTAGPPASNGSPIKDSMGCPANFAHFAPFTVCAEINCAASSLKWVENSNNTYSCLQANFFNKKDRPLCNTFPATNPPNDEFHGVQFAERVVGNTTYYSRTGDNSKCENIRRAPPPKSAPELAMEKYDDCVGRAGEINWTYNYIQKQLSSANKVFLNKLKVLDPLLGNILNWHGITKSEAEARWNYYAKFDATCKAALQGSCAPICSQYSYANMKPHVIDYDTDCLKCIDPKYGFNYPPSRSNFEGSFQHSGSGWPDR